MVSDAPHKFQGSEISHLRKELAELQQRNEVLENCLEKRDRSIAQLEQHNRLLHRDYTEALDRAEKATSAICELERSITCLQTQIQHLRATTTLKNGGSLLPGSSGTNELTQMKAPSIFRRDSRGQKRCRN